MMKRFFEEPQGKSNKIFPNRGYAGAGLEWGAFGGAGLRLRLSTVGMERGRPLASGSLHPTLGIEGEGERGRGKRGQGKEGAGGAGLYGGLSAGRGEEAGGMAGAVGEDGDRDDHRGI